MPSFRYDVYEKVTFILRLFLNRQLGQGSPTFFASRTGFDKYMLLAARQPFIDRGGGGGGY